MCGHRETCPLSEVLRRGERATGVSGSLDAGDISLPQVLDVPHSEAKRHGTTHGVICCPHPPSPRQPKVLRQIIRVGLNRFDRTVMDRFIDVRVVDDHPMVHSVCDQRVWRVETHRLCIQQSKEELCGPVVLEP